MIVTIILLISYILFLHLRPKPAPVVQTVVDTSEVATVRAFLAAETKKNSDLLLKLGQTENKLDQVNMVRLQLEQEKVEAKGNFERLQHQNKSSQVRTGTIGETLLPLHEQFPCDPKTLRFLGSPIDYISFDYEKDLITFVEVKTGSSTLNDNQRKVKKMVENKRVEFVVVRLNEDGVKVKK